MRFLARVAISRYADGPIDQKLLNSILQEVADNPECEVLGYTHDNLFWDDLEYEQFLIVKLPLMKSVLDERLKSGVIGEIKFAYRVGTEEWKVITIWTKDNLAV